MQEQNLRKNLWKTFSTDHLKIFHQSWILKNFTTKSRPGGNMFSFAKHHKCGKPLEKWKTFLKMNETLKNEKHIWEWHTFLEKKNVFHYHLRMTKPFSRRKTFLEPKYFQRRKNFLEWKKIWKMKTLLNFFVSEHWESLEVSKENLPDH